MSFPSIIGKTVIIMAALIVFGSNQVFALPVIGGQLYATGGDIKVTVEPSSAGYTHGLSLYSPIYEYVAQNWEVGTTVDLGTFTAGTELIFGIYVNNTGETFYTGPGSRNADGLEHAMVDFTSPGVATVGFEDLYGGGDRDYNDCIFQFSGAIAPTPNNPVPEPGTMMLLGMGMLGLAVYGKRRMNKEA